MVQFVSLIRLLIFRHCNYFPCCLILFADGKDEHALKLEKVAPTFNAMSAKIT